MLLQFCNKAKKNPSSAAIRCCDRDLSPEGLGFTLAFGLIILPAHHSPQDTAAPSYGSRAAPIWQASSPLRPGTFTWPRRPEIRCEGRPVLHAGPGEQPLQCNLEGYAPLIRAFAREGARPV